MTRPPLRHVLALMATVAACGGGANEQVGTACATPSQCYTNLGDASGVRGTVACLTQYTGGYCTHTCTSDSDCCAVAGECRTTHREVCASFENQPQQYCFLGCDPADIAASPNGGTTDPTAYCQRFFNPSSTCRSTGGGAANRRFCG
jgi:hypothetical protein